jgi:hypothetical protein
MKAGVLYDAGTLDEIWPQRKPFGDYYWVNPDALRSDTRATDYWDKPQPSSEQGLSGGGQSALKKRVK